MKLILASASPRRREILSGAGVAFTVHLSDADESLPDGIEAADAVRLLACRKARAVAAALAADPDFDAAGTVILAADTVVECYGEILGKPHDRDDARRMLTMLSGCGSAVHTGVCLLRDGEEYDGVETTYVTFDELTAGDIESYISTDEPYDKAGAYAIQGRAALYIAGITGDYLNVIGLPLHTVYRMLRDRMGLELTDFN